MLFRYNPAFTAACVPLDVHFARNSPFGVRLETVFIIFFTFLLFGPVCFFYKTKLKKVGPNFADRFWPVRQAYKRVHHEVV